MDAFGAWVDALEEPAAVRRPHWTWRALWREVRAIARDAGDAVRVAPIGASVEGEPLWSVAVDHAPDPAARPVLVIAGLHALEHIGPVTAVRLLARAATGHGPWARRRLVVVPVANPDGWLAVERSLATGRARWRRGNARGVDLNRNFAVGWDDGRLLGRLLPRVFAPGATPLSEPETRALDALAGVERPGAFASLHAFGEWLYLPYACRREPPPDLAAHQAAAREMCARMARPYRTAQLARRSRLFSAPGTELDHMHERHRALSFLFELGEGPRAGEPRGWFDLYRWYTAPPGRLDAEVANVLPALDVLGELAPSTAAPA